MKKITLSLAMIVLVGAAVASGTGAFFSDSETSTANTFTAGAIDLKVDSQQHYNGNTCVAGQWTGPSAYPTGACDGTWSLTDLGPSFKFFNFGDVKPGDEGENTVSLHIDNNPAWACADVKVTKNDENIANNPELKAGDTADSGSLFDGELAQNISVFAWSDNGNGGGVAGDNIWQAGEPKLYGPLPAFGSIGATTTLPLADSVTNGGVSLPPGATNYVGLAWCAGTMTANAGVITCNGSSMGNIAQTDAMTADITFRVEQSRNRPNFTCANIVTVGLSDLDPNGPSPAVVATDGLNKWFMYNDTSDTIDNTLGSFVVGPATPPFGTKSLEFTLGANPLDRKNIATYQFSGTPLSSITSMSYGAYSHGGSGGASVTESPFLNFNVDFTGVSGAFQKRLVYVPSVNGSVPQDTWNTNDAIQGGSAKWLYSGATWPAPNAIPGTSPKTWAQILADYPSARILPVGGWLGVRVGEPGPTGYIGNVDFFKIGILGNETTYDFGN